MARSEATGATYLHLTAVVQQFAAKVNEKNRSEDVRVLPRHEVGEDQAHDGRENSHDDERR